MQQVPDSVHLTAPTAHTHWWRHAVIYQIYVRSFADSNGDGEGDLNGIRERLPALVSLGVDAIWLTPFYALLATAHDLGLRVIIDIVPNHTSSAHRWFRDALAAGPGSPERDRYVFRPGRGENGELPPNNWQSIFGGPAWTRVTEPDGTPGEWYLHLFDVEQPDLNWENPEVRAEFADILRFWLDRGVDGFRIDVAHGMIKDPALPDIAEGQKADMLDGHTRLPYFDQDGVHEIYREWRAIVDSYPGERALVAEAWVENAERVARYLRPDELHQAFNFEYLTADWDAATLRAVVDRSLAANNAVGAPTTWVLSNHDVTRHVTRFGGGAQGLARARAALLLMLALPGSVYLYQGEELGLPEVTDLPEEALQDPTWKRSGYTERGRDGCRVPLPWEGDEPPFGFGCSAERSWLPVPAEWRSLTREVQERDPDSTLSLYKKALRLRRELLLPAEDALHWADAPQNVLAFRREPGFTCAVNFGADPVTLPFEGEVVLSSGPVEQDGTHLVLPGDTAVWLRQ